MDSIFNPYKDFVLAYIDNILVYSKNKTDHVLHLKKTLALFEEHGIIISKTKIEHMKERINFLRVIIGEGQIEMQPHIAEKVLGLPDNYHNNLKGLQRFLGLLNYARQFIKYYGRIAGPLYSKTTATGVKEFNKQDEERVKELKDLVRNIPKLFIPVSTDFLIITSDGSLEGWGAILECIPSEFSTEKPRLVAYNSGKYKEENVKSSIDQEILAVVYALDAFKAFIIDKNRIKVRTDCQAIVKFISNLSTEKKLARNRWVKFLDTISSGPEIVFEYIKGNENSIANFLSRYLISDKAQEGILSSKDRQLIEGISTK